MMAHPEPASRDDDAFADRRVYPRVPTALPASLQAGGERHSVQLLDVSAGGAKLNCAAKIAVGTAGSAVVFAGLTDWLDGYLARVWEQQSTLGRMLDPIADKLLVGAVLMMLVHDNTITQTNLPRNGNELSVGAGIATDIAGNTALFTSRNNRFVNNRYTLGTNPRPFAWNFGTRTEAEWRSYGQDTGGVFTRN